MDLIALPTRLLERLRRPPARSSVPGSLPVLFFGDLLTAKFATLGINPSNREYQNSEGRELTGPSRRFETLASLGATDRTTLTDSQCYKAIATMRGYFQPDKPVYEWFQPLQRVLRGMGLRYDSAQVAHLDLVQEATHPTWSELAKTSASEAELLRRSDELFLRWQIESFPLRLIVCNGRTPLDSIQRMLGATVVQTGTSARVKWSASEAHVGKRRIGVAGWNIPLSRPTGLNSQDEIHLGQTLAAALGDLMPT